MAINKVINHSTKSHGAMRNAIEYVLRDEKVLDGFVEVTGPFPEEIIGYDGVYRTWIAEKRLWDKDSGRMYAHNIISFHKDEQVTPEQVLDIGRQFVDRFFPDHQCLIAVHQDKEHLHCHILTNSVSYVDGYKLHQTKHDLQQQKDFTNELCRELGLSVTKKGHHFDGSPTESGNITAWDKNKYNLLIDNNKNSFLSDCAIALVDVIPNCCSRDDFISGMAKHGWTVHWSDSRKHIVFENESGDKVRDSRIGKTFNGLDIDKEVLTHEFSRQNAARLAQLKAERNAEEARNREYEESIESDTETFIFGAGDGVGCHVFGHHFKCAVGDESVHVGLEFFAHLGGHDVPLAPVVVLAEGDEAEHADGLEVGVEVVAADERGFAHEVEDEGHAVVGAVVVFNQVVVRGPAGVGEVFLEGCHQFLACGVVGRFLVCCCEP